MKKTKRRSVCPVACTLDIIGDKWTLLIIRDLLCGRAHFKEFSQSPEGIATNILTNRLERLLDSKIIETYPSKKHLGRDAYRLTTKGKSLSKIVKAAADWGLENIEGTEARMSAKN